MRATARLNYVLDLSKEKTFRKEKVLNVYYKCIINTVYHNYIYYNDVERRKKKRGSTEISMNKKDVMNRLYGYYTRLTA